MLAESSRYSLFPEISNCAASRADGSWLMRVLRLCMSGERSVELNGWDIALR
jgi:hypothetical protein